MSNKNISSEGAREIAKHLSIALNHPEFPDDLEERIVMGLSELFNDCSPKGQMRVEGSPTYIRDLLLSTSGNAELIDKNVAESIKNFSPRGNTPNSSFLDGLSPNFRPLLDLILTRFEHDQIYVDALIRLLYEMYRVDEVEGLRDAIHVVSGYMLGVTPAFQEFQDAHINKLKNARVTEGGSSAA